MIQLFCLDLMVGKGFWDCLRLHWIVLGLEDFCLIGDQFDRAEIELDPVYSSSDAEMPWNCMSMAIPVQSSDSVAIARQDCPPASSSSIYYGGLVQLLRGDCEGIVDCVRIGRIV